jgi:hypothetical protein
VIALFFMLGWDRYRFNKMCAGTHDVELVFLHPMGSVGHVVHTGASGARNMIALFFMLECDWYGFKKMHRDTLQRTCVFASVLIYGSCSAFW